jgi:hypothetical protein
MLRLRHPLGRLSNRVRPAFATLTVTLIAALTLAAAGLTHDFTRDLLLNVGAALALVPPTYLVFSPIFERLRQTAAGIQEHMWLDRTQVTDGVRGSRWTVGLMATWSSMLEEPYRLAFLDALRGALGNGAQVRILLLNPDSYAVAQRTVELDGLDVREQIGDNLRHLYAFAQRLDAAPRRLLEMRIYDASPSMSLYRWDDKVLISFYPLHERVATARQIETYVSNPLGEFAQSRFDELWTADTSRSVEEYMRMPVSVRNSGDTLATGHVEFVRHADRLFINATPFVAQLMRHGIGLLSACLPTVDGTAALVMSQIENCPAEQASQVATLFESKYGEAPSRDVIVRLG